MDDYSGSFEFDQAYALAKESNEVCLISLDLRSIRRKRQLGITQICDKGLDIIKISIPLGAINKKLFYKIAIRRFTKILKKRIAQCGDFDVIHAHFLDNAYITAKALNKVESKARFFVTEHTDTTKFEKNKGYFKDIVNTGYGSADGLITVSRSLAEKIYNNYGFKSIVISNVVDTELFYRHKMNARDRKEKVFVSVGFLTQNKRMDMLVRCFDKAFGGDPQYKLYICGDGPDREKVTEEIKRSRSSENIHLLGFQSRKNIAGIFSESDVFVLLSAEETFGVVLIEAMAAGLPVIATKSGGPQEFVTEETGLLAEHSEDEIVRDLKYMAAHSGDYDAEKISEYAISKFSPEVIARELSSCYRS
ncbi:MAG: glycosyltransferase [Eubacteriales bacterium]|nr:glycosyltransferase [Eubacteriales bacterium]